MGHNHGHEHGHNHAPASYNKAFTIGILLNTLFVIIEAVYGIIGNSLALLADAGHNLSDVLGLLIAWVAMWLGNKKPSMKRTYGYKRSSILAALFNAIFLLIAIGGIAWEAIQRFGTPSPVTGMTVIVVAVIGIVINAITALLFMSGRKGDLNIKGAFLHMAADAGVSLGVVIAGMILLWTGWEWIDPVVSLMISLVILIGTWGLLKDSFNLALDAVPEGINLNEIKNYLQSIPTVIEVHDLHVWGMSTTEAALTVHLIRSEIKDNDVLLQKINKELHDQFDIEHATIQIEKGTFSCSLASEDSI
ncbi:cation diffusion facilitator family transporter [Terrilactibacillus sp. BCM23-1]|uniref:Cation diffusion facilitator family transporter n=1 Tax=Terrilactibacillus tamarindi TaxID=2599694 RepID=A0A6N8CLI2_9BACI|nr:cation diffusion facilitator family transporter [Terrilactibacillus tamarindi]MTT30794.1 cation diffusion facilitator family transporter [Terrilactibacillus tamarindi]